MGPKSIVYLEAFKRYLVKFSEEERNDVIQEIQGHIEERLLDGQLEVTILDNLGDPKKLANAYRGDYYLQQSRSNIFQLFTVGSFYVGSSLLSMIVIPLLVTLTYGFLLCAIIALPLGIIDTIFEYPWISVGTPDMPRILYIPIAILTALLCYFISYFSKKGLTLYLKLLSMTNRRVISGKAELS